MANWERRRVLKGMMRGAAVTVALPFLDLFLDGHGEALAAGTPIPTRYGTWFWGCGINHARFFPDRLGADYDLKAELLPIAPYKNKVTVFSGFNTLLGGRPDMITMAKGLTNAAVPMGAVAVSRMIHDTVVEGGPDGIELFHGYTYSGHPLAAAAGIATLDLYRDEGLFERAAALHNYWEDAVHSLRGKRHIIDIRNMGLVAGIELEPRPGAPGKRAMELFHTCFDNGLLVRATGDIIALSPPLILEKAHIDEMIGRIGELVEVVE